MKNATGRRPPARRAKAPLATLLTVIALTAVGCSGSQKSDSSSEPLATHQATPAQLVQANIGYNLANWLEKSGDHAAAVQMLVRVTELDPRNYWARSELAGYSAAEGRTTAAMKWLHAAFDADASFMVVTHEAGFERAAADSIEHALQTHPKDAYLLLRRGALLLANNRPERASADLHAALALLPNDPIALRLLAVATLAKEPRESLRFGDRLVKRDPAHPRSWFQRGLARMALDDLEGAESDFTEALKLQPDLAAALQNRALTRHRMGDIPGAKADVHEFWRIHVDTDIAPMDGLTAIVGACDERLGHNSNEPFSLFLRGAVKARQGHYDDAIRDLTSATEREPGELLYQIGLSRAVFNSGSNGPLGDGYLERAQAVFQNTTILGRRSAVAFSGLAHCLLRASDFEGSAQAAQHAVALAPTSSESRMTLALALTRVGRHPEACRAFTAACLLPMGNPFFISSGMTSAEVVDWRSSMLATEAAAPVWRCERGNAHWLLGDNASARADYERCLRDQPDWTLALRQLGVLDCSEGDYARGLALLRQAMDGAASLE